MTDLPANPNSSTDVNRSFVGRCSSFLGPLWWSTALLFVAGRFGDLLNLYLGMFFLPDNLSTNDLGSVDPIIRLAGIGAIPLTIVSIIGANYLSVYSARNETGKIKLFIRDMSLLAAVSAAIFLVILLFTYEWIEVRLNLKSPHILLALSVTAILTCWQPLSRMVLQGLHRFSVVAVLGILEPAVKLCLCVFMIPLVGLSGYLLAIFAAGMVSILCSIWGVRDVVSRKISSATYYDEWKGIVRFAWPVAIFVCVGATMGFIEPFIVKHFLPSQDAAGFYMVMRIASIPMFVVSAVSFVLFPLLSRRHELGEDTRGYLRQATLACLMLGAAGTIALGESGAWLLGLRPQWTQFVEYSAFVWPLGIVVTIDTAVGMFAMHEMACRRSKFLWIYAPIVLLDGVFLYSMFGWQAIQPFMAETIWQIIDDCFPGNLSFACWTMVTFRVIYGMGLLAYAAISGQGHENGPTVT